MIAIAAQRESVRDDAGNPFSVLPMARLICRGVSHCGGTMLLYRSGVNKFLHGDFTFRYDSEMPESRQNETPELIYLRSYFGIYLRNVRKEAGMSLRELEARSGVNNPEIFKIESGEQDCRLESLLKISAALGIPWGKTLDDLAVTSFPFFADRIQKDPSLHAVWEKFPEGGVEVAVNIGVIAAWAAHLICCGHPVRRARGVHYYSPHIRDGFRLLANSLDQLNDYGARRVMMRELSAAPFKCLLDWNVLSDAALRDLIHRLHPPTGKPLLLERSALDLLAVKQTLLVWFPFFPASFNEPACPEPRFAIEIDIDYSQQVSDKTLVSLTWKELKRRLKNATAERGKKAAAADFAGVDRSNMNRWLDDDQEPGAEAAFRLLEWVTAEEAKQRSAGTGATAPAPKTQPKDTNESKLKSGRRKS